MPERNAPCPCGSGNKYKKCCGLITAHTRAPDLFAINQAIAYKGEIGRRRQAFCQTYDAAKREGLSEIEVRLEQEVAEKGETITCHKGCGHCCDVYIFANLQESENIVCHLYERKDVLEHYLRQYPRWKSNVDRLGATLSRIDQAQEKVLFGAATENDRRAFNDDLAAYAAMGNPCPFLQDDACTIYKVRPFVCAGLVSTSPSEYCLPTHPDHQNNVLVKAEFLPQNDLPYFIPTKAAVNFGCMPMMVQQILKYGYAFLSTIEGLEDIHRQATDDPEVRAILAQMGVGPR